MISGQISVYGWCYKALDVFCSMHVRSLGFPNVCCSKSCHKSKNSNNYQNPCVNVIIQARSHFNQPMQTVTSYSLDNFPLKTVMRCVLISACVVNLSSRRPPAGYCAVRIYIASSGDLTVVLCRQPYDFFNYQK